MSSCVLLQLTLIAYDNVYPNQQATSTVVVTVTRNDNGPVFTPTATYEKTVVGTFGVGEVILRVTANDMDKVSDVWLLCNVTVLVDVIASWTLPVLLVEYSGSGVELRTLDYENPGSNPVLQC